MRHTSVQPVMPTYILVTKEGTERSVQAPALAEAKKLFSENHPISRWKRIKDDRGKVLWRDSHLG